MKTLTCTTFLYRAQSCWTCFIAVLGIWGMTRANIASMNMHVRFTCIAAFWPSAPPEDSSSRLYSACSPFTCGTKVSRIEFLRTNITVRRIHG